MRSTMVAVCSMANIALLAGSVLLCACAAEHPRWMDRATLVLRPSHKQALLSYSFGAEAPRRETLVNAERSVAASIAAASDVNNGPLPRMETVDFKGGRFYIHAPRDR